MQAGDQAKISSESESQPSTGCCAFSGDLRPIEELLPYGECWVAPEHRRPFVEQVLEGNEPVAPTTSVSVRRRAVALAIDVLVKLIPINLVQLPFVFALADMKDQLAVSSPQEMAGMVSAGFVVAMLGAKVGQLLISSGYEIWMVGRYGATLGKMAVGARVTTPEGQPVGYGRAALRWAAKTLLNGLIFWTVIAVPVALAVGLLAFFTIRGGDVTAILPLVLWMIGAVVAVFLPMSLFPWWMAIGDRDKRSLHDRVAATRVREASFTEEKS